MTAPSLTERPAEDAGRVLFEPLAPLLRDFATLPPPAALNDALAADTAIDDAPSLPRFVAAETLSYPSYEGHVAQHGEVPTRSHDWHDFFNALAWRIWPRSKTALNHAHIAALATHEPGAPRCRRRDALTQWQLVTQHEKSALVLVHLVTGRTHQIRVHFSQAHHPVLGDPLYGHKGLPPAPRLMLHAWSLGFSHPVTGERMAFTAPPEACFGPVDEARLIELKKND